jgi:hypothetical protein
MSACEKCGKELEEEDRFCPYCGTPTGKTFRADGSPATEAPVTPTGEAPPTEQATMVEATKPARGRRIAMILIFLVAIAASALVVYQLRTNTIIPQPTQTVMGADWSGYAVSTSLKNPQPSVTEVSGTWTVPSIMATPGYTSSASWVGVGGQFDPTLIQVGTEHDAMNGVANYTAWYELLPSSPKYLNLNISPGDTITASIRLMDPVTNTWSIDIKDATRGQSFQTSVSYQSSMLTAEWIVERPTIGRHVSVLSDFGSVTFTGCRAVVGGKTGGLLDFPSTGFILYGRRGNPLDSISQPSSDGSSFTVFYESSM